MEERVSSQIAARMIGIKTQTLAKWRCLGKGPSDWVRVTPTLVTYSLAGIQAFLANPLHATSITAAQGS